VWGEEKQLHLPYFYFQVQWFYGAEYDERQDSPPEHWYPPTNRTALQQINTHYNNKAMSHAGLSYHKRWEV